MMKNAFATITVAGVLCLLSAGPSAAQFDPVVVRDALRPEGLFPESAQSWSYIPQIASGPSGENYWATSLTIHNPHPSMTVRFWLSFFNSAGEELPLSFNGMAPQSSWGSSRLPETLPPGASVHLRDSVRSEFLYVGYAVVSSLWGPVQATATYTLMRDGSPVYAVSVPAALPSTRHEYAASARSGIAVVNPHRNQEIDLHVIATDASGNVVGQAGIVMPSRSHRAFVLRDQFVSRDVDFEFEGTVILTTNRRRGTFRYGPPHSFAALVLRENGGVVSSLPSGAVERPIDLNHVTSNVFERILQAAHIFPHPNSGQRLALQIPLRPFPIMTEDGSFSVYIDEGTVPGDPCGTIQFDASLGELLASSESELAFAMGHVMGHFIQCRFDQRYPNAHSRYWHQDDDDLDADSWGIALSMLAGYDPYAAAGALAKISMVIGAETSEETHFDRDMIWRRLDRLHDSLRDIHNRVFGGGYEEYRDYYYPHFPRQQTTTAPAF